MHYWNADSFVFIYWATNTFDAWKKYLKLDILLSIAKLHASEPKLLVNYLIFAISREEEWWALSP